MVLQRNLLFAFFLAISFSCYAKSEVCRICSTDLILQSGVSFTKLSHQSQFAVNNVVTNRYDGDSNWQGRFLAGVGLGRTFEQIYNRPYNLSINVVGYYFNLGRVNGTERPFINGGNFDTLNYKFHVESYSLFLEPHLIYTCENWQPYVLAGVGIARNSAFDFEEIPINPALSAAPVPVSFQRQAITRLAYEAGLGVQHSIYKNTAYHLQLALSLDYRYLYLGKAELGTFPPQSNSNRLQISPLYTQTIMLALTARYYG